MSQIHILDGQKDIILDYITAKNIIDDNHKKSLENTLETYDFITFADKRFSQYLEKRNRIIIPDEDNSLREFIIFEGQRYRDTEGLKAHIYANASYLELKKASIIYPNTFKGTASQHAGRALNDTGWQVGLVEVSGDITININEHTNPYENLKRISKEFKAELRFRIEHDGSKVIGRYVDLLERVGDWQGREVTFGKDLDSIRRVEKQDIVTALLGLGPEKEDGTRLEVLVEDEEALQRWGRIDEHGNLKHLIEVYEIQSERTEMTETEARQYTRTALDKRINTQVTYETTIVDLEEVIGHENKKIRFGDTIRIKDEKFNPPLYLEARVFEINRSIKSKAKKDIKLGDYIEYTEEEVNSLWEQLRKEIQDRLARLVIATIVSSGGDVFKNGQGETELIAKTFVNGHENDEDGQLYDYQWIRFDKDGNQQVGHFAGKKINVTANDVDEKATYRVLIAYGLDVVTTAEYTLSHLFDGQKGEDGKDGKDGKDGYTPIKGTDYFDGKDGQDGKSEYLWVRYSQNENGNPMSSNPSNAKYIGIATTNTSTAPSSYTDYNWTLIKGNDGVAGESGADGQTSYLHIKYSNDGGQTFTSNNGEAVGDWIGTYVDFIEADSSDVSKYTWNKVKGEKGDPGERGLQGLQGPEGKQGIPGAKGADGRTSYTHIAYADTASGGGFSQSPTDKKYIGMYVDFTATDSTDPSKYKWSLIKGADGTQGVPGPPGADGKTPYFHTAWANNANGTSGFSTTVSTDKLYIGTYTDFTQADSTDPSKYNWTKIKGDKGEKGDDGVSVTTVVNYYLASASSSGVTSSTAGWTTTVQNPTATKKYLWNYEKTTLSNGNVINTPPTIIGNYAKDGAEGKGISSITEYYQVSTSNTTAPTNWVTTPPTTTVTNKYLWNYERITYTDGTTFDTPKRVIGTHGNTGAKGDKGDPGAQGIQGPPGANGTSQYVHIRYSINSNGNPMTVNPVANTQYIGLANTTSATAPTGYASYTWAKFKGENGNQGIQGPAGTDGQTTYTWVKYADNAQGGGMSDSPDGKLYIGLAFNKTTATESNVASQYTWSLMPQNIEIGGRNYVKISDELKVIDNAYAGYNLYINSTKELEGKTVAISFDARSLNGNNDAVRVYFRGGSSTYYFESVPVTSNWKRYVVIAFITKAIADRENTQVAFHTGDGSQGSTKFKGEFKNIKLEIGNKATDWTPAPEDVDESIQKAQTTADGKNSIFKQNTQPSTTGRKIGDVWFQTNADNKMFTFNGTSWVAAQFGEQAIVANSITALHIKSLNGLNVNDQFKVDNNGNVTMGGNLDGATGTFSGELVTSKLKVRAPNVTDFYDFGLEIETAQAQTNQTQPFKRTGFIQFVTGRDALEISRKDLNNVTRPLEGFSVDSLRNIFYGKMSIRPSKTENYGNVLSLDGGDSNHVYMEFFRDGVNRQAYIGIPDANSDLFRVRSDLTLHLTSGPANFYIGSDSAGARIYSMDIYNRTYAGASNIHMTNQGTFGRSTSARKYKKDIEPIHLQRALDFYEKAEPVFYRAHNTADDNLHYSYYGYIADQIAEFEPRLPTYSEDGEVEGLQYERAIPLLHMAIKHEIEHIKKELEDLKNERNEI